MYETALKWKVIKTIFFIQDMIFTCLSVFVSIVNSKTWEEGRSEEATAKLLILIPVAKFIHEISFLFHVHVQRISRIQITLFSF
jgi:hypothetical protein